MPASSTGHVFITGAAAGIGAAATRQLAAGGNVSSRACSASADAGPC